MQDKINMFMKGLDGNASPLGRAGSAVYGNNDFRINQGIIKLSGGCVY